MKRSILLKTFVYTVVLCMGLFIIHFIAQEVFLSKYYREIKIKMIERDINRLKDDFEERQIDAEGVRGKVLKFSGENRISVEIIDKNGRGFIGTSSKYNDGFLEFEDGEGEIYQLGFGFIKDKSFVREGDDIKTYGVVFRYGERFNMITPYDVKINGVEVTHGQGLTNEPSQDGEVEVSGTVLKKVGRINTNPYTFEATFEKLINIVREEKESPDLAPGEIRWNLYIDKNSGFKYETYRTDIFINDERYIFIGSLAIESINDTLEVIRLYNSYLMIFVFVFVMVGAYIYARRMTAPMIEMDNIAKKMSSLDFHEKVSVKTEDEMGRLGNSLNKLAENLQRNMKELNRTNEMLQIDIEKEQKRERDRRRLIADLSHELKTPLTIIEGIASGIRDGIYKDYEKKYILSIIDEINLMNGIIFDMLQLSKIESESFKLDMEIFDLSSAFLRVHSKMKELANEKSISVEIDIEEGYVLGDIKKIEGVISNLYSNAIRYTERNKTIYVRVFSEKNNGVFQIENEGALISEEDQEKIWDAFYRCDESRSRELGGTGLGLKIVREVINHHGGECGTYNSESGVVFFFKLKIIDLFKGFNNT